MDRNAFYDNLRSYADNSLIHGNGIGGRSALYGTKRDNVAYYKREGTPGNYKYYYTKEEWEAAHRDKGATSQDSNQRNTDISTNVTNKNKTAQAAENAKRNVDLGSEENKAKRAAMYDATAQKGKYDRASKSNKYDKDFVKYMKYMDNLNKENCLEEYKKYLNDPVNYPKNFLNGLLAEYSQGGNVDLTNRPEIDAKLLQDAEYDAEDGYATIFSGAFSNRDETATYNFTPIQVDPKTGEFIKVLKPEEFEEYCYGVVDGIHDDYLNLQIGDAFIGEDSIQQAINRGKKIHSMHEELHELNQNR